MQASDASAESAEPYCNVSLVTPAGGFHHSTTDSMKLKSEKINVTMRGSTWL